MSNKNNHPQISEISEIKQRWFVYLDNLESKINEFCEAAIPELKDLFLSDEDVYKRNYQKLLSGVKGQINQSIEKVVQVKNEKILNYYKSYIDDDSFDQDVLSEFRNDCESRFSDKFEKFCYSWIEQLNLIEDENLEEKYQNIINEYESIKESFKCVQCSGNLTVDRIFFISVYIACPYCKAQNIFNPGSQARQIEQLGRKLAEQRCSHLLTAYKDKLSEERDLYFQRHQIKLSAIHEKNKKVLLETEELMNNLEKQRLRVIADAPALYEKYLRAMFDEMNKIVPDLKTQNEKIYNNQLIEFKKTQQKEKSHVQ